MKKTKTTEILIPFEGFYETISAHRVQEECFYAWPDKPKRDIEDIDYDLTEEEADKFWNYYCDNYETYQQKYAENYARLLLGEIETAIDIKLPASNINIDSPREYNFTTDRIFLSVPTAFLIKLYNSVNRDIFAEVIKDKFTDRPGFTSFYANDINDPQWQDPASYDHNQWLTVIEAIIKQYDINEDELYYI